MGAISKGDVYLVEFGSGVIEMVKNFTYLCSRICSVIVNQLVNKYQITKASKAFGALENNYFPII